MERLSAEQVQAIETKIINQAKIFNRYRRYYRGENPPIMDAPKKVDPDNRVPCPYAKKIVDTMKGYGFKAGKIRFTAEGDFDEYVKENIFDPNDEELLTAEIATDMLVTGIGFEVVRMSENLEVKQYRIKPETGYAIYDGTLENNMICFIHMINTTDIEGTTKTLATIYYDDVVEEWQKDKTKWEKKDEYNHPFGIVPVIQYRGNMESLPLFYEVIPLMDEADKVLSSNYSNEMARFAQSYLLMLKRVSNVVGTDGRSDAEKIAELRMFDGLGADGTVSDVNQAVGFLTKPSRGADVAETADRYERLIYDLSCILNPNDFKGGGALSGRAYEMKTIFMEMRMADIEAYFSIGLQRRIQIIGNGLQLLKNITPEPVTIQWQRNLPIDLEYYGRSAASLKGIVSDRTILEMLPADIVPSVQKELEELANVYSLPDDEE